MSCVNNRAKLLDKNTIRNIPTALQQSRYAEVPARLLDKTSRVERIVASVVKQCRGLSALGRSEYSMTPW